jgi:hypothetical protein
MGRISAEPTRSGTGRAGGPTGRGGNQFRVSEGCGSDAYERLSTYKYAYGGRFYCESGCFMASRRQRPFATVQGKQDTTWYLRMAISFPATRCIAQTTPKHNC